MSRDGAAPFGAVPAASPVAHACCPDCGLRFTPADAAYLPACPMCGEPMAALEGARAVVGLRLFRVQDSPHALPEALAAAMPIPTLGPART